MQDRTRRTGGQEHLCTPGPQPRVPWGAVFTLVPSKPGVRRAATLFGLPTIDGVAITLRRTFEG